jgi:hypothetical protein
MMEGLEANDKAEAFFATPFTALLARSTSGVLGI